MDKQESILQNVVAAAVFHVYNPVLPCHVWSLNLPTSSNPSAFWSRHREFFALPTTRTQEVPSVASLLGLWEEGWNLQVSPVSRATNGQILWDPLRIHRRNGIFTQRIPKNAIKIKKKCVGKYTSSSHWIVWVWSTKKMTGRRKKLCG